MGTEPGIESRPWNTADRVAELSNEGGANMIDLATCLSTECVDTELFLKVKRTLDDLNSSLNRTLAGDNTKKRTFLSRFNVLINHAPVSTLLITSLLNNSKPDLVFLLGALRDCDKPETPIGGLFGDSKKFKQRILNLVEGALKPAGG